MGRVRSGNANLPWHRLKRTKVLLAMLVVHLKHIVNVAPADLFLPATIPSTDNLVLMETLDNDSAICLQLAIKGQVYILYIYGQSALDLVFTALFREQLREIKVNMAETCLVVLFRVFAIVRVRNQYAGIVFS